MTHSAGQSALPAGSDPREHARALHRIRLQALSGAEPPQAARTVIGASWRRARRRGLDPGQAAEVPPLVGADLTQRRAASGLEPLMPLLRTRLLPAAEAAGQIMVVADDEGRVLWREGGPDVRHRADRLGFVEGSAWDESTVGTNAIGTSIVTGEAVHVFGAEHYAESHTPWTCAAAPLHDPVTRAPLGVVDLSGPAHTVHQSTVSLVDAVARLVELELRAESDARLAALREVAEPVLAQVGGPAVVVAPDGATAAARGVEVPGRVWLPTGLQPGALWLPALGAWTAEPLPGGWLLRPRAGSAADGDGDDDGAAATGVVLDLRSRPARLRVAGGDGAWEHRLTPRHTELVAALAAHPEGLSAAQLATEVFGDAARTVTVRAELSRLRRALGPLLAHQPYRLAVPCTTLPHRDHGRSAHDPS
ncbi:GAF domain-containing protein [Quadrisphaera oryzae]|uniref:helix-turn-helix domain-containing protein n=1 Tax=Quadrisphaera TaxID=317661 RepID=UPI001644E97B|nr:GAF domain-containing protein [Quadrisphaera sp. RL12-1S]